MVAVFCARCGVKSEADDAFCVACGAALRRAAGVVSGSVTGGGTASDDQIAFRHAVSLLAKGENAAARQLLQRLVDDQPDWAIAHAYLGIACLRLIRVGDAREHCEAAVRLAPESFIAHTKYAEFLAKLGFYDQALAQCDIALALPLPDQASEMAARELREFCKQKAKGIFYRQIAPPSRFRFRNLMGRRQSSSPKPVERGL